MLHFIYRLMTQAATITAAGLLFLAYQYMDQGIGLHPFLALPGATLMLVFPHLAPRPEDTEQ